MRPVFPKTGAEYEKTPQRLIKRQANKKSSIEDNKVHIDEKISHFGGMGLQALAHITGPNQSFPFSLSLPNSALSYLLFSAFKARLEEERAL